MEFKIVTFNIRFTYDNAGMESYIYRESLIRHKVMAEKPDVIAFQEVTDPIANDLVACLPEYQIFHHGRNADLNGEGLALALRKDRVELMGLDVYWLSETPYAPGSKYPNSVCPRVAQQALVRLKGSDKTCWVFNNHFDHHPEETVRVVSMKQVLERVATCKARWDAPVFILGDLNAMPETETMACCDSFEPVKLADLAADSGPTFHGFGRAPEFKKIDYIYSDLDAKATNCQIACWDEVRDGIYLSDHYPVSATLEL